MDMEELIEGLLREPGVVRVEVMPPELVRAVDDEEHTVTAGGGTMCVDNCGMAACMSRDVMLCAFTDSGFVMPPDRITMHMVDSLGKVVGHDVPSGLVAEYAGRTDVVFMSDDFVLYPDIEPHGEVSMVMMAVPYRGHREAWIPEEMDPVIWYPSTTSSDMIKEWFGVRDGGLATGLFGVNL